MLIVTIIWTVLKHRLLYCCPDVASAAGRLTAYRRTPVKSWRYSLVVSRELCQEGRSPRQVLVFQIRQVQQVALGGLLQKLVAVFVAGIPLVVIGGVMYSIIAQEDVMAGFLAIYGGLYHIPGTQAERPQRSVVFAAWHIVRRCSGQFDSLCRRSVLHC